MLFVLSPAKALDYETPAVTSRHTDPLFVPQSKALIEVLRGYSPQGIAELMDLSDTLSGLNVARYQAWSPKSNEKNAKQAVLAFNGDVYDGLNAKTLSEADLDWLHEHLGILSGLYGVLRPLDLMQPYRLEMGTKLPTAKGKNLYQFWGSTLAVHLDERASALGEPLIVNLASEEYFKSVDRKALKAPVLTCVFEERKGDQHKVVSFMAKRARGLMVRYAVEQRVSRPEQLQGFDTDGYLFAPAASSADRWVFRRPDPEK
jgi:cytoplasmic iron level regulating protein YaaA (DUF328/UPF0246 family)